MPRKIDDVIIPERKRSIRDIPIPERPGRMDRPVVPPPVSVKRDYPNQLPEEKFTPRRSKKKLWISTFGVLVVLILVTLSVLDGATLSYIPKSAELSFENDTYKAEKTGTGLPYSVVKLSKEKTKEVPASGTEEVKRKASGTIVVYNNASTESQRLIENTRFQSAEGKIYRIKDAIVIPGKKTVAGSSQPGSIEVVVYADEAGESYNAGLSDFTLPGLAGTPRFQTIYARSKTPMSGGFVGMESSVKSQDKVQAEAELHTQLKYELTSEANAQVPEGFILYPTLSSVTFESLPSSAGSTTGTASVKVKGDFTGIMFKQSDLSNHLAQKKLTLAKGESVDIVPIDALQISFAGNPPADIVSLNEINLSVTGKATVLWKTDEVALKADLQGKRKSEITSVLNNYPTIVSATTTIKPFWKKSLPSDSSSITIKKLPVK